MLPKRRRTEGNFLCAFKCYCFVFFVLWPLAYQSDLLYKDVLSNPIDVSDPAHPPVAHHVWRVALSRGQLEHDLTVKMSISDQSYRNSFLIAGSSFTDVLPGKFKKILKEEFL